MNKILHSQEQKSGKKPSAKQGSTLASVEEGKKEFDADHIRVGSSPHGRIS